MMADANKDKKPGEKRTPSPGYKSALGKARDKQKAEDAKAKAKPKAKAIKAISQASAEDTASEDSDSDSDDGSFCGITAAVTKNFTKVKNGIPMHRALAPSCAESPDVGSTNSFSGLADDLPYDMETLNK